MLRRDPLFHSLSGEFKMANKGKTRAQLLGELSKQCRQIAKLEKLETKHKDIEAKLERYKTLMNTANAIILAHDDEWKVTFMNPYACKVLGYKKGEMIGKDIRQMLEKDEYKKAEPVRKKVTIDPNMSVEGFEQYYWKKDKKERVLISWNVTAVKDADGKAMGIQGVGQDITERKKLEDSLRKNEKQASAAIEAVKALTFSYDIATGKITWGGSIKQITGYAPKEFAKVDIQAWADRIHPDDRDETLSILQEAMKKDRATAEYRFKTKEGYVTLSSISLTEKQNGKPIRLVGILQDITERKKAEEELRKHRDNLEELVEEHTAALRESEDRLRLMIGNSLDVIFRIELDKGYTFMSPSIEGLLGYRPQDYYNDPEYWRKITYPDDIAKVEDMFADTLKGKEPPSPWELRQYDKDGNLLYLEFTLIAIRDGADKIIALEGVARDITERKQTEEAVEKERQRMQNYLDIAGVMLIVVNADQTLSLINKKGCEVLGYEEEEVLGKNIFDTFIPKRMRREVRAVFNRLIAGDIEPVEYYQNPWLTKSGEERMFAWHNAVLRDEEGAIIGTLSSAEDITERKKWEEALQESEIRFRSIFESKMIGTLLWDANGDITDANEAFLQMVGYTRDEVLSGKVRWRDMTPLEYKDQDDKALKEIAATGVMTPIEKEYIRKDGSRIPIILGAASLPSPTLSGVAFALDINERKKAEEKLKNTMEDLARSNKELEQFAYVASHDLLEPLRMVASYVQLLERRYKGKLDSDADDFIAYAVEGATRMQRMIHDLLAYSRIGTRGKKPKKTDCAHALGLAITNLHGTIEESGAVVSNEDMPTINFDEPQIIQLFQNLIDNAIKFRRKEPLRIHVGVRKKEKEWLFSVRDNGIGIDPQYGERIFVIFQRLHEKGKYPGTGIGLSVCKRIVERHGGRIWVESKPGKGSTFFFTIPRKGGK